MADSIKAQKLAAARKKLKEFQQKTHKPPKGPDNKENVTPQGVQSATESLASSTHSLDSSQPPTLPYWSNPVVPEVQTAPLQNYFSGGVTDVNQLPTNFFDSYATSNVQDVNYYNQNINLNGAGDLKTAVETNSYIIPEPAVISNPEQFFAYEIRDEDVKAEDYPEIKHNEIFDKLNNVHQEEVLSQNLNKTPDISSVEVKSAHLIPEDDIKESSFGQGYESEVKEVQSTDPPVRSNLESLNQLSSQLHHLVTDYETYDLKHNNELEKRNQELAALLEQERVKSEQLQSELNVCKIKILQVESESQHTKIEFEGRISRELGPLQEQLQYHMQTVGILVAEKTELTASLSQSQIQAKQKSSECEELQGRLKTSRSRAADLEKELNAIKAEKTRYDRLGSEKSEEVTGLRQELIALKDAKEEVSQDLSELREKFNISASENLRLQHEIQELSAQLSLANVKIQQLSAGETIQTEMQVEELVQQKLLLEKHIAELHQNIKTVTGERDQASVQYQQYTQQLNTQLSNIAQKLEVTTQQNEGLLKREQDLVQHIGELEKHLQSLQNEHVNFTTYKNNNGLKKELDDAVLALDVVRKQKEVVDNTLETYRTENEDLLKELATKKDAISEMEGKIERLEGNQPDSAKLLAAMESDKVAAARAVTQNTQLKKQLEDMEEVFIKISNDKLDLTEQLTSAQHQKRELTEKLHQTETQLHTLAEAIEIKDRELTIIREGSSELNKQVLQQGQLADRLRHYEAQEHTVVALQNELQDARHEIEELVKENGYLKQERQKVASEAYTISPTHSPTENAAVDNNEELQQEYEVFKQTIAGLEERNKHLQEKLSAILANQSINQTDIDKVNDIVGQTEPASVNAVENVNQTENVIRGENVYQRSDLDKEEATRQLEEKFKRTMEDIANLQDEKQRLEHVVLQLQGETETIGEYIALYQHQRGILNQRAVEKENQLKKITYDREQMRFKLEQLNSLVRRLMMENETISPDILEEHRQITENAHSHECSGEHHHFIEPHDKIVNGNASELAHNKAETAQKIIALLSEIKTNTLVSPSDITENFHPCPCCSGLLITV